MNIKGQYGVGLIEVLVALLLLALGIFGFIALQYRANEATLEATSRVQAMNIARDLAERIRINNNTNANTYQQNIIIFNKCFSELCTATEKAQFDLYQTQVAAQDAGMSFAVIDCPNTQNGQQCIYVAWDKTMPKNTNSSEENACTQSAESNFSYVNNSTCVVLETYS